MIANPFLHVQLKQAVMISRTAVPKKARIRTYINISSYNTYNNFYFQRLGLSPLSLFPSLNSGRFSSLQFCDVCEESRATKKCTVCKKNALLCDTCHSWVLYNRGFFNKKCYLYACFIVFVTFAYIFILPQTCITSKATHLKCRWGEE